MPATVYEIQGRKVYHYQFKLVDTVLDLHGYTTGAAESDIDHMLFQYRFLCKRIENWEDTHLDRALLFEEHVRGLCIIAKAEFEQAYFKWYGKYPWD